MRKHRTNRTCSIAFKRQVAEEYLAGDISSFFAGLRQSAVRSPARNRSGNR